MTAIHWTGIVFLLLLLGVLLGVVGWSTLTESGQRAREQARTEQETQKASQKARAERKKLTMVQDANAGAAWYACKEFAETELVEAETRTWSESYDAQVIGEYALGGANTYRVRGHVDSFLGNAAGDVLRTQIDCTLTEESLDEWTLGSLSTE